MKTIEIKLYKFDELSEAAQDKAIEHLYDINVDFEWWDSTYDCIIETGACIGIDIDKIYFSGFYSQGDGACFEGEYRYNNKPIENFNTDKDLERIIKGLKELQKRSFYQLGARVKQSGHYMHENCTRIETWHNQRDITLKEEEDLEELLRDFMRWIYRTLEQEYEYLTSKEAIIETIRANDYDFTVDGKLY